MGNNGEKRMDAIEYRVFPFLLTTTYDVHLIRCTLHVPVTARTSKAFGAVVEYL